MKKINKHVAIIGGGITGVAAAKQLKCLGYDCTIYEKNRSLGGLIACEFVNENLFHKVGGHVFNSKKPDVLAWFWNHFDVENEFIKAQRKASIYLAGQYISYPIELNLRDLDEVIAHKAINDILSIAGRAETNPLSFNSLADFFRSSFGDTLYDYYFKPYNEKIWKTDLSTIGMEWLEGKLPMMSATDVIVKNILAQADTMVHSSFYYPKMGGSQFIIDRLAEGLTVVREHVYSIESCNAMYKINGSEAAYSAVVYTGDIRKLPELFKSSFHNPSLLQLPWNKIDCLRSNGTTTMLCECDKNPFSWIYLPDSAIKPHRIIMTGNLSDFNSSSEIRAQNRTTCTVEYSGKLSEEEFRDELLGLPLNMRPISLNYCDSSYVLHTQESMKPVKTVIDHLAKRGLFLCGRFAEWQYYNMDAAIESAINVASRIKTYFAQ